MSTLKWLLRKKTARAPGRRPSCSAASPWYVSWLVFKNSCGVGKTFAVADCRYMQVLIMRQLCNYLLSDETNPHPSTELVLLHRLSANRRAREKHLALGLGEYCSKPAHRDDGAFVEGHALLRLSGRDGSP